LPAWAAEFDQWIASVVARRDWDGLVTYPEHAPGLRFAHPTDEHLRPLVVAAGAAAGESTRFVLEGWEFGTISRRSVQFGEA
jgi:4,5-DOPA dioxygenase extradiol